MFNGTRNWCRNVAAVEVSVCLKAKVFPQWSASAFAPSASEKARCPSSRKMATVAALRLKGFHSPSRRLRREALLPFLAFWPTIAAVATDSVLRWFIATSVENLL